MLKLAAASVLLIALLAGASGCAAKEVGAPSESAPGALAGEAQAAMGGSVDVGFRARAQVQPAAPADEASDGHALMGRGQLPSPRKIIYTATITLVAPDLNDLDQKLRRMLKRVGGYLAGSNISGPIGGTRTGAWTLRVPVGKYESTLVELKSLGELQAFESDSNDVSEEFYDLEARLRNKAVEEARLIEHLKSTRAKLSDILNVERELSRVRGEIEQMEGRKRFLKDQTDLTTVTLNAREPVIYLPKERTLLPARVARAWDGSLQLMREAAEGFLIGAVALVPWLIPLGILLAVIAVAVRRRRARRPSPKSQADD